MRLPRQIWSCGICKLKLVVTKHLYEWNYQEEFFNKTDAFAERLRQLLINKINVWWSSSRLSLCFIWSYNTYISLGIVKDSSDCFWQSDLFFFFIVNTEKNKIRRNHYLKHVFSWVSLNPRTTDPPANRPPTTYSPTHWLTTQRLTESIIISGRVDNRNIFILQNTNTAEETYNCTSVYCPKSLLVSMIHIRRSQLCLFF